jgi:hypothetical protein
MWSTTSKDLYKYTISGFQLQYQQNTQTHQRKPCKFLSLNWGSFSRGRKLIALYLTVSAWWSSSACWQKYIDTKRLLYIWLQKKRFLWTGSCRPADRNMSVGRPARSSSKAPFRTPSQKIHHLCYYGFFKTFYLSYVASIYVMYLCSIFFPRHSQRKRSK